METFFVLFTVPTSYRLLQPQIRDPLFSFPDSYLAYLIYIRDNPQSTSNEKISWFT